MRNLPLRDRLMILVLSLASVLLIAGTVLVIYWLQFDDNPPITVNNAPLPVHGDGTYKPGDTILFTLDFCRHTTGAIRFTRRWIDGLMYIEPEVHVSGGDIECIKRDLVAVVPDIPPGVYHVEYNVIYQVNPMIERTVTFVTESFEVLDIDEP